jgi:hypothetical protein
MAQSETAPTHEGTIDSAVDALSNFNFDTGEMSETFEPQEQATIEDEDVEAVEEEELEEDLTNNEPVEATEEVAIDTQAIDAPVSWSAEQKEEFASAPPAMQEIIVAREAERDRGFQAKSTELAQERRQYEEAQQAMNIERQTYAQTLSNNIGEQLKEPNADLVNPNSPNYNPEQFYQDKTQYDQLAAMQQQAKQQADYYAHETAQVAEANKNAFWGERNQQLSQALPEFIGDAQYRDTVLSYAKELGYSDGELEMARASDIVTINKAMQYDKIIAAKVGVGDKLKTVPKVGKPGNRNGEPLATRRTKANKKAHHMKGDVNSAARLLEGMF